MLQKFNNWIQKKQEEEQRNKESRARLRKAQSFLEYYDEEVERMEQELVERQAKALAAYNSGVTMFEDFLEKKEVALELSGFSLVREQRVDNLIRLYQIAKEKEWIGQQINVCRRIVATALDQKGFALIRPVLESSDSRPKRYSLVQFMMDGKGVDIHSPSQNQLWQKQSARDFDGNVPEQLIEAIPKDAIEHMTIWSPNYRATAHTDVDPILTIEMKFKGKPFALAIRGNDLFSNYIIGLAKWD